MRASKETVEKFFSSQEYAVIGVSGDRRKFGNIVYRTMKQKGFAVYPVNPGLSAVEDSRCYPSVADLPSAVKSAVTVVPPSASERIMTGCAQKGIMSVWMQPGSESENAVRIAGDSGIAVIHGECILMFLEPVRSFHALHRWLRKIAGTYPK